MLHWVWKRGGANKPKTKLVVDDEEEEVQVKRRGVYTHGHAQTVKLTEEQLIQTEKFRKSHVPPRNILRFFREQNVSCVVSAQKIYNLFAKIKKNRMQGRNMVEEVLCLSTKRGYTIFYRNREDSNVLSDIVVAHPTSIEMMRRWSYVLIMDTTYTTNNHLALKKIWSEILRATGIYDDPHYLRTSHVIPCACELITQFDHVVPIQLSNIEAFWKTLEIGGRHPSARQQDSDSEMRSLTDLLHQISTGSISKVREMRHPLKGLMSPVLPKDLGVTLTSPPEIAVTKGRKKTNSTKRDKSHWKHVSISLRKIQKSSGSSSGSGSGSRSWSGSGSGSGSRGRGRLPRAPRGRAEGATVAEGERVNGRVQRIQW
ncbi:hypothetical protein M9H77_16757 [Catharanthus roseus]|uniref:Uncharacterized protein n=1 Tax=Catharanthus roseus TaxID=4058 RepID=A0ACC0B2N1_CATRO|nr:hypothetical protein M9H77_16757 [Catharanthus roseus]